MLVVRYSRYRYPGDRERLRFRTEQYLLQQHRLYLDPYHLGLLRKCISYGA
jgi:hypothetical protein